MLKVGRGSGASEVEEVAAEVVVHTDMDVEEIALVVEMLVAVKMSVVVPVAGRTDVVSVEVEESSVGDALAVDVSVGAVVVDVMSPSADDVVTEEVMDSVEVEADVRHRLSAPEPTLRRPMASDSKREERILETDEQMPHKLEDKNQESTRSIYWKATEMSNCGGEVRIYSSRCAPNRPSLGTD